MISNLRQFFIHKYSILINMAYLNPNTIVLDPFSAPEYVQADFLIENAGTMNFLQIDIDRTALTVTKSIEGDIIWDNNASIILSNDLNIPNYITLNPKYTNSMLHTSFLTETSPHNLLKGIVFCICVKNIFQLDSNNLGNLDFIQDSVRLNQIFFQNDPTGTIINDIRTASETDFDKTLTSNGTTTDEYAYWDTTIGSSNESITFVDDDKMYSFYGLRLKLLEGTTPTLSGTSISDVGDPVSNPGFQNSDGTELYFVMSWNIQISGFGEGNASSGPKQNWNVEFLDLNTGASLYDSIVKTDSNGSFLIPQHAINADIFEISVTCIDSSGFDTLTGEQSDIGENFTAIGTSEVGFMSQASPLSSVLAQGFKENGNFNLTSYTNLKSSYESAFGITDINNNPYDTEIDDTNSTTTSSKILQVEVLMDGMRTILSENSSMSRSIIQKKIRKAISQKLTSSNIDFTNSTMISDVIETAAGDVVDNGANVTVLKNKATGISSSVNYIKSTFNSHSGSNRNTRLLELHKSARGIKNTFKASPNFNTDITNTITTHRNLVSVSGFNVPSRKMFKRNWNVRFTSDPLLSIDQDATYTYTPIAKGSVQQRTPITIISKPSWLTWNGTTLQGSPNNSHVGSHSVILKTIEGSKEKNQPFAITVNNINDTPTFTNSPPATIDIANQTTYSYTPTVNDIDVGDTLTITCETDLTNSWLTWNGTTLQGSPNNSHVGDHSIHLRVSDNGSPQRSGNLHFIIGVIYTNNPPTFTSTPSAIIDEDSEYNYTPTASDPDVNNTLNFSVPTKPSWLNWNGTKLNGIPTNNDIGNHNVTIRVNDGTVNVDQSFIITVNAVNDAPIFTSTPSAIIDEDTLYSYTPTASDEEGDSLTFTLHDSNAHGPAWLNWDGTTLSGTPTNDNVGNTTVTIRVSDGAINVDQSFTITVNNVNDAPVFTTTPNATVYTDEDALYTYTPTATDVDVGDTVTITLHDSNAHGPSWLNWDGTTLSGTPTNDNVGNTTVTLRANDGTVNVDQSFTITVNNVNDPPVFTSTPPSTCLEDTTYSYTPTAIDVDLNYSLSFSLHDKNEAGPAWLNWNGTTLSGIPVSGNVGNTTVTLRVTDGTVNVDQSFTIQVVASNKLVMKVSGITQFDAPFHDPNSSGLIPYMLIRLWDNDAIEDEGEMTSKTGLNSSTVYKLEMVLPVPDLNDTAERWGIYFYQNSLISNNTLNIVNFNGVPLSPVINTDNGSQFRGFDGQISANDSPGIRVNTSVKYLFMDSGFTGQKNAGQHLNLSNWDMTNVTLATEMFKNTPNLGNNFDVTIQNWNLINTTSLQQAFFQSFGYNITYNSGTISLTGWNIGSSSQTNGVSLEEMFKDCTEFNGDVSNWTITNPNSMLNLFNVANEFTGIGLSSWTVTSPAQLPYSLQNGFNMCYRLGYNQHIDISDSNNNGGGTWDYTYVSTLKEAFRRCGCLGINTNSSFKMDGSNFINLLEDDGCYRTFFESFGHTNGLDGLTYSNASNGISMQNWKISKTTGISLGEMFRNTQKFNGNLTGWEITNPSHFGYTFSRAYKYRGHFSTWTVTSPA